MSIHAAGFQESQTRGASAQVGIESSQTFLGPASNMKFDIDAIDIDSLFLRLDL
jgi:hypothetical protein